MKILITGFEPFGGHSINPSQKLVEQLPDTFFEDTEIVKAVLPVDKDRAPEILLAKIKSHHPDSVVAFGLASERTKISLERVALNLMDFRIPDNKGRTVLDQPVVDGGPTAYFTTLPIHSIAEALKAAEIPVEFSLTAGTYLCNQVFYRLMHAVAEERLTTLAGFIHLPGLPEQSAKVEKPVTTLSLETILQAAHIIIEQIHSAYLERGLHTSQR